MVIAKCDRRRCSNVHKYRMRWGQHLCESCKQEWMIFLFIRRLMLPQDALD